MAHAESVLAIRHGKNLGEVMDYLVEVNCGYVRVDGPNMEGPIFLTKEQAYKLGADISNAAASIDRKPVEMDSSFATIDGRN